ncbi:MAG TPA: MarR family transcriptional regulator [Candidatus Alistipes merdigallinarum]|nr:MarR family transcriptional regulator [Candidatus Alistipes merdigallinarum]
MEEKILKALQEKGAMRPGDIATAAGVEKSEADKVIKKLVKEGKIYSPKRCYYDVQK